jgi:glycosyltransferase involved in cell wall biosynthesis
MTGFKAAAANCGILRNPQEKPARPPIVMSQEDTTAALPLASTPKLSVVVPFYNESENIKRMHAAIVAAVAPLGHSFEMVFVDDGSKDDTLQLAIGLAESDPRVRVVKFRRNYGQTPAMAAGIQQARGEIIITMDGDLQNDPADIAQFLARIDEGCDIVVGWRFNRQDKMISRKIPSRIANKLIGKVTGVPIRDNGCSLKAFRSSVIKNIPLYSEMHRFIPAMASISGPRIAEIKVRHHARQFGQSKYGLSRVYKVLLDLLVIKTVASFTSRPLLWFAMLSVPLLVAGTTLFGYSLFQALSGSGASLSIAGAGVIFLAGAAILISSGAVAEVVFKTGDIRERDFARLTRKIQRQDP